MKTITYIASIIVLTLLLFSCDRDHMPTESELGDLGGFYIVLTGESSGIEKEGKVTKSSGKAAEKEESLVQAQLSATEKLNILEIRVLDGNDENHIEPVFIHAKDNYFRSTIDLDEGSNLKVLCLGKNNRGVARFAMAENVNVRKGEYTKVNIDSSYWKASYIPEIQNIDSNLSNDGSFTVSWSEIKDATGYYLREATNSSFTGASTIDKGNNLTHSVSDTIPGVYYYQVQVTNNYNIRSGWSYFQSVRVIATPIIPPTLYDPGEIFISGTEYSLFWSSVKNTTSYNLEESKNKSFEEVTVTTLSDTTTKFVHNVTDTTIYYYRVKACISNDCSEWSDTVEVMLIPEIKLVPPDLINPKQNVYSGADYKIEWEPSKSEEVTSYIIEEANNPEFIGAKSHTLDKGTLLQEFYHIVRDTIVFFYHVKICTEEDCGDWSDSVKVDVLPLVPPDLKVSEDSVGYGESYFISWERIDDDISEFRIEESSFVGTDFIGTDDWRLEETSREFIKYNVIDTTIFYYRAKACTENDCSEWSDSVKVKVFPSDSLDSPVLEGPGGKVYSGVYFEFKWNSVKGAESYRIIESSSDVSYVCLDSTLSGTSVRLVRVVDDETEFYYEVQALPQALSKIKESGWSESEEKIVIPIDRPTFIETKAFVYSGANYTIEWESLSLEGITKYRIEEANDTEFLNITGSYTIDINDYPLQITHHETEEKTISYYYHVRAYTQEDSSVLSGPVKVEIRPLVPPVLVSKENVKYGERYRISWERIDDDIKFILKEETDGNIMLTDTVKDISKEFVHYVSDTTTYYYSAKACTTNDESEWSVPKKINVHSLITPTLICSDDTVFSGQKYRVEWDTIDKANSYTIEERSSEGILDWTISETFIERVQVVDDPTPFYYRIRANDERNGVTYSSGWSELDSVVIYVEIERPVLTVEQDTVRSGETIRVNWFDSPESIKEEGVIYLLRRSINDLLFQNPYKTFIIRREKGLVCFDTVIVKTTAIVYYQSRAIVNSDYSAWSDPVSIVVYVSELFDY